MDYCHLHAHSTYSILDAWGHPEQIVERVQEAGLTAHTLTDHDSTSGHWKFQKAMRAADLHPVYGVEIRVMDDLSQREWKSEEGRRFYPYHLGLIARNAEGYKSLMQLVTLAWQQGIGGRGKYMPAVTWEDIGRHNRGLIGLSGCLSSKVARIIRGEQEGDWASALGTIQDLFEPESFFVEWQNLPLDACQEVAEHLHPYKNSVVTHDVHFPTTAQREAQNIMSAVMRYQKVVGPDGQGPMDENCFLASADEVLEIARGIGTVPLRSVRRSMQRAYDVAMSCDVTLPQLEMVRFPHEGDKEILFKELVNQGWRKRGLNDLPSEKHKEYVKRARYEFSIIAEKDYIDYFLIIADICQFAVQSGILKGPARGSSAGSLLAWCLEITEIDPIVHGLIFERFIDLNRADLPDIDLDFPDDRREDIHEFLRSKYGRENVAVIGTFTTFRAKAALDDVARVYGLPQAASNAIKPYLPDRAHGDVRSALGITDAIEAFQAVRDVINRYPDIEKATLIEGQYKAMGVHPAGVVVSSAPVEDVAPIYEVPGKGRVIGLDGWDIESAGMVKIDILGLSAMKILADAKAAIESHYGTDLDFYTLDLNDPETLQGFTEVDVLGIFQFNGKATKNTLRQIRPTTFDELVDINTLSRPGAMLAGTTDEYVKIAKGKAKPESIHPIIDEITSGTYNLVLYQEQVLRIMREFGGLSWKEAGEVRKFLSKNMGMEILQRYWDQFVEGAVGRGIDEKLAREVWLKTSTFGAYGFNRSHSVAYSMVAYWQMHVKRHYPVEFYYAALANEKDEDLRHLLIREAWRRGVKFLAVDPELSDLQFSIEPEGIRYGLTQIKGVGGTTANRIIDSRPFDSWDDVGEVKGIGAKTIEVFKAAASRGDDLFELRTEDERITSIRQQCEAISLTDLQMIADSDPVDPGEVLVAGQVISRNYRQEAKLATQAKHGKTGQKSDTVILYIRDESGVSFPVVVNGRLGNAKEREIWEGTSKDVYLIRGRLPEHGKFMLASGIANTTMQDTRRKANGGETTVARSITGQLSLTL